MHIRTRYTAPHLRVAGALAEDRVKSIAGVRARPGDGPDDTGVRIRGPHCAIAPAALFVAAVSLALLRQNEHAPGMKPMGDKCMTVAQVVQSQT